MGVSVDRRLGVCVRVGQPRDSREELAKKGGAAGVRLWDASGKMKERLVKTELFF